MRDGHGGWRCPRCRPAIEPDWAALVAAVQAIDPRADAALVLGAARQAAPRPAQQRALVAAVTGNPGLLNGSGAEAPVQAVFRLIDLLTEAGVDGVVRPACPRCDRVVALVKWVDGVRICQRCDRQVRAAPCAQCGRVREVNARDLHGQPVCGACRSRDPANLEPCVQCGHRRPVNHRTARGPICASCKTPAVALCMLCGRTAPSKRSTLTGQPRCRNCAARRLRCGGCGQIEAPHSGTLADPRCFLCTIPGPGEHPRRRECPTCGRPCLSTGECAHCRLSAEVRALLTDGDDVRPELRPLLAWWEGADRPDRVRRWLARRPATRAILRALADGTVPPTHQGFDEVDDTNTVRYLRRVLVAAGVLPAHDEHLNRLQRWLHRTLADIADPQQRRIVHRYAHWYQLRRLRARTGPHTPVTTGQAATVREHVNAAAAVLATLATAHRSLADLRQADVDQWLATEQVARRAELGAFLRWARHERLTTVALPVLQWADPRDRVDHDQRWAHARRLLHDETLPTEVRIAGLLVVLYAQTATNIRTLRFDQVHTTPDGARITFGTTPIDLPPTLATLIMKLSADRTGTERATTPWIFPGRPWTQPISADMLRKRLTAIGISPRTTRTAALFQLAVELPAAMLARCLGIDISSAVAWQRAAAGDWHPYAARTAAHCQSATNDQSIG